MRHQDDERAGPKLEERVRDSEERLRLGEAASGIATFQYDLNTGAWDWSNQAARLFGLDGTSEESLASWEKAIFFDDLPKIRTAIEHAPRTGKLSFEVRVQHPDGGLRWIAGKGEISDGKLLRGAIYDISDRKALEARLLALNETLEARVAEVREEARTLEVLNRTGVAVAAEHDLERLVQIVTDSGVELSHARIRGVLLQCGE